MPQQYAAFLFSYSAPFAIICKLSGTDFPDIEVPGLWMDENHSANGCIRSHPITVAQQYTEFFPIFQMFQYIGLRRMVRKDRIACGRHDYLHLFVADSICENIMEHG